MSAEFASAASVTLSMDEVSKQPIDGLSLEGVTFGFTVDGATSTDANYDTGDGGEQHFTQEPVIEGTASGVLALDFDVPTKRLDFGVSLYTDEAISPGFSVELFDASRQSLGVTDVDTSPRSGDTFSEGQFSYTGVPVARAVISFDPKAERFGFDNLTFERGEAGGGGGGSGCSIGSPPTVDTDDAILLLAPLLLLLACARALAT
jgi:hypothetical protein